MFACSLDCTLNLCVMFGLLRQVAYLLVYGHLPPRAELERWTEAVMRHSAVPVTVENVRIASFCSDHMRGGLACAPGLLLLLRISTVSSSMHLQRRHRP